MVRHLVVLLCFLAAGIVPAHAAAPIVRGAKPIKGRYIITFKDDVSPHQINVLSKALARQHGGRLLATMTSAMRGFGAELPEYAVEGLRHHPFIKLIEQDQFVELSAAGTPPSEEERRRFDFRAATAAGQRQATDGTPGSPPMPPRTPVTLSTSGCAWQPGGYYACFYANVGDTYWNLDRIDNTGLLYSTKAYAFNSTGNGVRAYVVDSGVYANHEQFEGRVVSGANMMVDPDIADPPLVPDEEAAVALDYAPETNPCFGWLSGRQGISWTFPSLMGTLACHDLGCEGCEGTGVTAYSRGASVGQSSGGFK